MRILKTIGIVLVALIGLLLLVAAILPKNFSVERSTNIEASSEAIFPHVKYFEKRDAWYPWNQADPTNKSSIEGEDGTVGAITRWEGEVTGKGMQTITALEENKKLETKLVFVEPYESEATTYLTLAAADKGTTVTWGLNTSMPYPMNIMGLFVDFENSIGKDYEKGLANLKEIMKAENNNSTSYKVEEIELPTRHYLAIKEELAVENIAAHYADNFPKVFSACQKNKIEMAGMPCGLFYSQDIKEETMEVAQAIPVATKTSLKGYENIELPAGKCLKVDYYGDYDGAVAAHDAIEAYCKSKGIKTTTPVIEQYITDPEAEPDTSKWLTTIYYPIGG